MAVYVDWPYENVSNLDEDMCRELLRKGIDRLIVNNYCRNAAAVCPRHVRLPLGDEWVSMFGSEDKQYGVLFSMEDTGVKTMIGLEKDIKKLISPRHNCATLSFATCGCGAMATHHHHGFHCCGGSMCCQKANE